MHFLSQLNPLMWINKHLPYIMQQSQFFWIIVSDQNIDLILIFPKLKLCWHEMNQFAWAWPTTHLCVLAVWLSSFKNW